MGAWVLFLGSYGGGGPAKQCPLLPGRPDSSDSFAGRADAGDVLPGRVDGGDYQPGRPDQCCCG